MFLISQKINIPQEEIREFNPDVEKNGLKAKMKLWIPAGSISKKEDHSLKSLEEKEKNPEKNVYLIALFTSLNLSKIYLPETNFPDSTFINEPLDKETSSNLEFLEGALKSVDDMHLKGFKTKLTLFDAES